MSAGERATTPPIPPQRYRWKDPTPPAVIDYLQEENRVLLEQLGGKRRRFASLKLSRLNVHHVPLQFPTRLPEGRRTCQISWPFLTLRPNRASPSVNSSVIKIRLFAGPIVLIAARGKLPLPQRPEAPLQVRGAFATAL
jgi:hypothetical protein